MKMYHNKRALRNKGAAIITAVMLFVIISITVAIGLSSSVVREYVTARDFEKSKGAYYLSEAGSEDAIYRIKKTKQIDLTEILSLGGNTATTSITNVNANKKTVVSVGDIIRNTRRVNSTITTTTGEAFVYGVWAGPGGVYLKNGSSITGNLYSAGPVCGGGGDPPNCTNTNGTNVISAAVISGGTSGTNGLISNIQNQGGAPMYAGTIKNSTISGLAYCSSISGSSTSTCQTVVSQPAADLPITRADIDNWENVASTSVPWATCSGGKYTINTTVNFGPKKVPCDLYIEGAGSGNGPTVTLQGPIWVTGNIDISKTVIIKVDPTLTGQTIVMVADKASDRRTSSQITVSGSPTFTGAPGGASWIMLISENNAASNGYSEDAISVANSAAGNELLLYSRLGDILLQNNSAVKEVTGYRITLVNNTNVSYATGLQNALFTSGPGGAWAVQDWKEGQ